MAHRPGMCAGESVADLLDLKRVSWHRGTPGDFLRLHTRQVQQALKLGKVGIEHIAPALLDRVSDQRTLFASMAYLRKHGGQAPGPDGLRYGDMPKGQIWKACRDIRDEIRSQKYTPGREDIYWIQKGSGRGKHPLVLQDIFDRAVQRACVEILQPVIDPQFDSRSFGYRPKRNPLHALALAERVAGEEERNVWVAVDIKNAFLNVPLNRLLDVVRVYLPDDNLISFLRTVLSGSRIPGLRQGGPLSPLMLNLYLHHLLDVPWRKRHEDVPLIRYADDILLLCKSLKEARRCYDDLTELLRPTGMLVKESKQDAMRCLGKGEIVNYMGYGIQQGSDGLCYRLTEHAWDGLAESFRQAQEGAHAPIRAVLALCGWIGQRGPCFPWVDQEHVCKQIGNLARKAGFDEIPLPTAIKNFWQRAYARWSKLRNSDC